MSAKTDALHPDHLQPGDRVGPWLIVQVLGRGGSSRVFKVEREGVFYSMKMALRPLSDSREELSEDEYVEERSVYRHMAHEAAALFTYSSHPNLLRVYAVDFWPNPRWGYPFIITDFVDGDDWHRWRWRKPPHAAGLVDTFCAVVRTVGVLHARGVFHRDLKAENILIRRTDGRPFVIDFGTVRLPGALTKTMGVPDGVLHLLPPELLAYIRSGALKRGEPFQGGVPADLYALGVLLYQSLTDLHPFDPELPDKELVAAIATVPPAAPHVLNPLAPRALSDIAMKLLEKAPEARYPNTQVLLQALERVAGRERQSPGWRVPLTRPDSPALEDSRAPDARNRETALEAPAASPPGIAPSPEGTAQPEAPPPARDVRRGRWLFAVLAVLLLLVAMGLLAGRAILSPSPVAEPGASAPTQRGHSPVSDPSSSQDASTPPRRSSLLRLLGTGLCAATSLGCPAAQVRPEPADCPSEVLESMFKELKIRTNSPLRALVDVNQPGRVGQLGLYREGPVVGSVTVGEGLLVEGSLLYGHLWTGPGLMDDVGREAVIGRYTKAVLPDGKTYPVCIALGGPDGRMRRSPGPSSETVELPRDAPVNAVWRWP